MTKRVERVGERERKRERERVCELRVDLVRPFSGTMMAVLVSQQLSKIDIHVYTMWIRKRCTLYVR